MTDVDTLRRHLRAILPETGGLNRTQLSTAWAAYRTANQGNAGLSGEIATASVVIDEFIRSETDFLSAAVLQGNQALLERVDINTQTFSTIVGQIRSRPRPVVQVPQVLAGPNPIPMPTPPNPNPIEVREQTRQRAIAALGLDNFADCVGIVSSTGMIIRLHSDQNNLNVYAYGSSGWTCIGQRGTNTTNLQTLFPENPLIPENTRQGIAIAISNIMGGRNFAGWRSPGAALTTMGVTVSGENLIYNGSFLARRANRVYVLSTGDIVMVAPLQRKIFIYSVGSHQGNSEGGWTEIGTHGTDHANTNGLFSSNQNFINFFQFPDNTRRRRVEGEIGMIIQRELQYRSNNRSDWNEALSRNRATIITRIAQAQVRVDSYSGAGNAFMRLVERAGGQEQDLNDLYRGAQRHLQNLQAQLAELAD